MKVILSYLLIICSVIISLISCKRNLSKINVIETVNIESNIKNFDEISLSKFNAEIKYIPLSKENNLELGSISHIDFTSNLILVSNPYLCLLYDYNGKIVKKISEKGRGPTEYSVICNSSFGFNRNIYIQVINNFLEFKTDGTLISSFDINKEKNPLFSMLSWMIINDSLFLGQIPPPNIGNGDIKAILFDKNGIIKHKYVNYIFLERPTTGFSSSEDSHASFYTYANIFCFKEMMNDTLFWLTNNYELRPRIAFNLGEYAKPKETRTGRTQIGNEKNPSDFIYLKNVFEISTYLFLDCNFGFHTPARRITPKEIMGLQQWYNTQNVLGLYNKVSKSLSFCKPTSTDNPLISTGFINDLDAGPRFYPVKQVNDSTMVMWIEAKDLKDHVASDDFISKMPKYPDNKKQLEELANNLNEFDNPVLMFVTFKSN